MSGSILKRQGWLTQDNGIYIRQTDFKTKISIDKDKH